MKWAPYHRPFPLVAPLTLVGNGLRNYSLPVNYNNRIYTYNIILLRRVIRQNNY